MREEEFFDLRIATVEPGEEPPLDAHWIRIEDPPRSAVGGRVREGWFYKPKYVTYVLPTPSSLESYIESEFRTGTRNKPRRLLRRVPERYRLVVDEGVAEHEAFTALYRRTVVSRERGKDRVTEHHEDGFGRGWVGLYLREGNEMIAGILVHQARDLLSVGYGGFDPAHRDLDLEHYLIMKVLERARERRLAWVSLGMDTNRYGHHLPLGLPAYKLRLGFVPLPCEEAGRELVRVGRFDVFPKGLFFYSYDGRGLVGNYFARGTPDLRPLRHHNAPPIRVHPIEDGAGER